MLREDEQRFREPEEENEASLERARAPSSFCCPRLSNEGRLARRLISAGVRTVSLCGKVDSILFNRLFKM